MTSKNSIRIMGIALGLMCLMSVLQSQFYFGRNKIQYDDFRWQVLQTGHFNIYYYEGEESIARTAAYFAEEALDYLEVKFNYSLNSSIPLVIYSNHIHFQQTNIMPNHIPEGVGGFFEFIKKRVVIPFNGNIHDFRHVIRHELVHVFTHAKIQRAANDAGLWETPHFPLWFIEGLAELWSTDWDSQAEMVIRDALLYDHLFPLDSEQLYRAGFLLYKEGQSFLRYIERTYGTSPIRRLMAEYWQFESFQLALSHIIGKSYETLMLDWKMDLKKEVALDLNADQILPNGSSKLTKHGTNVSPAYYTDHEGRRHIIYLSNRVGYSSIFRLANQEKKRDKIIIKGERSADKESLHILQTGLNINQDGILAYVAKSGRQDYIYLVDLNSREETGQFVHHDIITIRSPKWNRSGTKLVFGAQDFQGFLDLYTWEVGSNQLVRLTRDFYTDQDPVFGADDRTVIFASDRNRPAIDGELDLFAADLSTGVIDQLTGSNARDWHPLWHNDRILFLSDRSGTANIWEYRPADQALNDQAGVAQLTNFHTGIHDLSALTADSLLASAFQKYSFQIYKLPATPMNDSLVSQVVTGDSVAGWELPNLDLTLSKRRRPYKLDYSLDLAQTAVAYDPIYGLLGGAQLSISDILGNRYYHLLVTNTAESSGDFFKRFNFAVTMVDLKRRANRAIGVFHFANDYFDPYQAFYFERSYGLRVGVNYPLDIFRRLEFSGTVWQSEKDFYTGKKRSALLLSNFVSFVHDNSLWYYTGPVDGWRLRITAGPTFDFKRSQIHNITGLVDFRYYWRFHPNLTYAQRTMLWVNDGIDIRRYYIGGSWGIRGYHFSEIYGRKYVMFNQELRFPFARSLSLNFGKAAIGIAPIRGALFLDAGNAWDYQRPDLIGSFGFGLRGMFLGGIVLRLDMGRRTDFHSVEDDMFYQFFFGWDF